MPKKKQSSAQENLFQAKTSTAPCVPAIREAVADWKANGYPGVTATTRLLLNYWFKTDHRLPNGRRFAYHSSQQEAIETLIYLYEVAKIRRQKPLLETFAPGGITPQLLQFDDFARYCIKMATGSGKTKVIALAIVWSYFNAARESDDAYARTFLLLAPNVIVYERLCTDFANGRVFVADPMLPPELKLEWDFDVYRRGEGERASSTGALYVTNIQQLHDRPTAKDTEPDAMLQILGSKPPAQKVETVDFAQRIAERSGHCLVINDEAHHTHDEKLKWNEVIRDLHQSLDPCSVIQLDFTATPRYNKGALFTWTIYDYPLKQAILDGIVKRPIRGVSSGIGEQHSDIASVRYKAFLTAGVERWREYRDQLAPLSKKPLLFIMMNSTTEADDVEDYLKKTYPSEFGGDKLLNIHTDVSGEVSKKDLEKARQVARGADKVDNPVNAIVSVLMLREGWDVQNVTVVVGLRPYASKANILPEQTIGRGLRLMFRGAGTAYVERVDVIGNKGFLEFVDTLEKDEDIQLEKFEIGKDKLEIVTIQPDPEKMDRDIAVPFLSPILARKKSLADEIAALDVMSFSCPVLPQKQNDAAAQNFKYEGKDLLTLETLVEREYKIPEPQTAQEVISYYAKRIAQDVKLPSQFAALVPKVREFLENKAFGQAVSLDAQGMVKAISSNVASYVTIKTFAAALRCLVVEQLTPELLNAGKKLSVTPPFPWSRQTVAASKTVFSLAACENEFEKKFAQFLQNAPDIEAFAKLPTGFAFAIEYTDNATNLRYYEPDFVVRSLDGTHYLVETKGREDVDVVFKDRAAALWCENATILTGTLWNYLKVPQGDFAKLQADEFSELFLVSS